MEISRPNPNLRRAVRRPAWIAGLARALARMIRRAVLVAIGCCAAAGAPAGEHTSATKPHARAVAPRLSAEQIVEKNVTARGGLDAWRKIRTMVWMGRIESTHAPVPSLQFLMEQERPNKVRFEVNALGDRSIRVFDGLRGWKLRPSRGRAEVAPFTPDEVRFEKGGPGIDGPLFDYADKGSTIEVVSIDDLDKRQAYHLIVRTASGETQHVWVDAQTFLEARYDRPVPGAGDASRSVSVVYRDYKDFEGVKIPSVVETGVGGNNVPDRMVIEKVVLNPRLDEWAFSEPGARGHRSRAGADKVPFAPRRAPGANALPPWLKPATPAGPPAATPGAAPPTPSGAPAPPGAAPATPAEAPAPASPGQPDSPSASSQGRESGL